MANGPHYPAGKYVCEIVNQGMGETQTGKPQFVLRFKVLGRPDPAEPNNYIPDPDQYERTSYRVVTEATIPYFMEDLKALGYTHGSFKFLDPNTQGYQDFTGKVINMICNHEDNQEKTAKREKWGLMRAAGVFDVKPLESKKMRDLDNLFGKHLKDLKQDAPKLPPPPANGFAITDDDVPF